jgi:endonuclease/exonuclease/phosphatase family metal-dependent hydrolase
MSDPAGGLLRVATYNIHRCRGLDGRTRPERIAEVLHGVDADVIALQEVVGAGPRHGGHAQELGAALGMGWAMAPTRLLRLHAYGNVVLSRFPIVHHVRYDLSVEDVRAALLPASGRRPRADGCSTCTTSTSARRFSNGASRPSVWRASSRIAASPDRRSCSATSTSGRAGPASALLSERLHGVDLSAHLRRRRTYPGVLPLVHLDHIYHAGPVEVRRVELVRTRRSLIASDHLPLVAELAIGH